MEAWKEILVSYPYLQTLWDSLCVIVPLAAILAYAGIFFISAIAKIIFVSKNRVSFNKCSRQLALIGLILGWTILVASRVWLYYTQPFHKDGTLENFMREMSWMFLSLGVLLSSIYYTLWRVLKNMPVLHVTIGMISAAQNCIALIAILFTIRLSVFASTPPSSLPLPDIFPHTWNAPIWSAICYTIPLIFAFAAGMGGVWLIIRRNYEDFGRDYYNSMLAWCSAWARNCWLALWLLLCISSGLQIWQEYAQDVFSGQTAIEESSRLLLWLIPLLLWASVCRSKYPVRQRWIFVFAFFIAICFTIPYYLEITIL